MEPTEHWERIYSSRAPEEVSWYEPVPSMSGTLVAEAIRDGAESFIDVGGGASNLVDQVLGLGLKRIAVLDISEAGLAAAKRRLVGRARRVEWIVADITRVEDIGRFDIWHDRAVFHFLTDRSDRRHYVRLAERTINPGGAALMATFAMDGPERCSGLAVRRYDAEELSKQCGAGFELAHTERHLHITPQGVAQSFQYSTFHRAMGRTA